MKNPIFAFVLIFGAININVHPAQAAYTRCQKEPNRGSYCFSFGDSGKLIYELIEELRCAGYYYLGNDSYFGPVTKRAIMDSQRDYDLYPDGIAGPQTRNLLIRRNRRSGC